MTCMKDRKVTLDQESIDYIESISNGSRDFSNQLRKIIRFHKENHIVLPDLKFKLDVILKKLQ